MGFENRSRPGLAEIAAKIALKFGVVYSVKRNVFDGAPDKVAKANTALDKWSGAEWLKERQIDREMFAAGRVRRAVRERYEKA